jgi:hypothetical protein
MSGLVDNGMFVVSESVVVGVFTFLVRVVLGVFDLVLTSFATTSPSPSTGTTFLGLPLFFGTTSADILPTVLPINGTRVLRDVPADKLRLFYVAFQMISRLA